MKNHLWVILTLLLCAFSWAAGDHFPIAHGNAWLFTCVKSNFGECLDGWCTRTDSGTVKWEMVSVALGASVPGGVTTYITIKQTTSIVRRVVTGGTATPYAVSSYDSVFVPARVSIDSVRLTWKNSETGISILGDSCWSFVHDPRASIPAVKLAIRDTTVFCLGKTMGASIIDPALCRGKYDDLSWFITSADVGPVGYHMHSSPYIMDAAWQEDWSLTWTNVTTSVKIPINIVAGNRSVQIFNDGKKVILEGFFTRPGKIEVSLYNPAGSLLGNFSSSALSAGWQRIVIPHGTSSGAVLAKGIVIMKIELPDGNIYKQLVRTM
jgi:hypothetical protein